MTKIIYNGCYGSFSLSKSAILRYAEIKGITLYTKEDPTFTSYYLCPVDEYKRIQKEESNNPIGPGRYARSNEMHFSGRDLERNDPVLVQVVEELGHLANGHCADLRIVELPVGTLYRIDEYDGNESVMTKDDYEWSVA